MLKKTRFICTKIARKTLKKTRFICMKLVSCFTGKEVMTLGQKQRLFSRLIARLILWAYENGYEVTFGDAYRDPRVHGSMGVKGSYSEASSSHKERLAVDLNLFKDGVFLTRSEDHAPLGAFWKSLHPDCRWGGDFKSPDGNHYSMTHEGRA